MSTAIDTEVIEKPDPLEGATQGQGEESYANEYSPEAIRGRMKDFGLNEKVQSTETTPAPEQVKADEEAKAAAAKAEAEKAVVTKPVKKGSDGRTQEERDAFVALKTKAEQAETRIKELEGKVASGEATSREMAELKAKNSEWEKKYGEKDKELQDWLSKQDPIALEAIKSTEMYHREVQAPTYAIEQELEALCKSYDVNHQDLLRAHYTRDRVERNKQITELKSGMDEETKSDISEALRQLTVLDQKAQQIQQRPQEALTSIKETEAQKQKLLKEKETTAYQRADEAVWKHVITDEFPLMKEDPAIAARVREKAKAIDWSNMAPDKRAYLAHGAFLALEYRDHALAKEAELNKRIAELEASNKKLGGKPSLASGHGESRIIKDTPSTSTVDENMSTKEAFEKSPFFAGGRNQ